ncbi:MAG: hypothetical protein ACYC27_03575 [Armatimonadota bacterium]
MADAAAEAYMVSLYKLILSVDPIEIILADDSLSSGSGAPLCFRSIETIVLFDS